MKKIAAALLIAFPISAFAQSEKPSFGEWYCAVPNAIFDAVVSAGDVRVNNFSLVEGKSYTGLPDIEFSYSATNRGATSAYVDVQIVGFDVDKNPLFALRAAPAMAMEVKAGGTENARVGALNAQGGIKKVSSLCIKVMGGWKK